MQEENDMMWDGEDQEVAEEEEAQTSDVFRDEAIPFIIFDSDQ